MSEEVAGAPEGQRNLADRTLRRRRAALAGHNGDEATARALLDDEDGVVRATALGALARCGAVTAADLLTALADPDPTVRIRAATVAAAPDRPPTGHGLTVPSGGAATSTAIPDRPPTADEAAASPAGAATRPDRGAPLRTVSILPLLDDPDATVVEAAAWACGERLPAPPGTVARLVALTTGHDDPLVREAAVAALGAIGDPAGLDAVLAATTDRATVRRRAVLALAPFDGPEVDAALERARTDRDWQVRQAAEDLA